jgi:hypothetical protein
MVGIDGVVDADRLQLEGQHITFQERGGGENHEVRGSGSSAGDPAAQFNDSASKDFDVLPGFL